MEISISVVTWLGNNANKIFIQLLHPFFFSPVTPQMLTLHYYSYGCPENVTQLYKETTQQTRMMHASKRPRSSKHHPEDQGWLILELERYLTVEVAVRASQSCWLA